jgi:transketolase C-terminal domain/subunit
VLRDAEATARHATIFAIGNEVMPAMDAAETLAKDGYEIAVINARFIKPLDDELIRKYCTAGAKIVTVEEGSLAGGFGAAVMERCEELGITDVDFHRIGIPDEYVHHGSQDVLRAQYDLHAEGIAKRVRAFVGEAPAKRYMSLGEMIDEITKDIPDEEMRKIPDSSQIDEVVYGIKKTAAAK